MEYLRGRNQLFRGSQLGFMPGIVELPVLTAKGPQEAKHESRLQVEQLQNCISELVAGCHLDGGAKGVLQEQLVREEIVTNHHRIKYWDVDRLLSPMYLCVAFTILVVHFNAMSWTTCCGRRRSSRCAFFSPRQHADCSDGGTTFDQSYRFGSPVPFSYCVPYLL